ncbi:inositol polyphosphate multikinase [Podarcis lilfordi]|uniref:Kinase n=1 Tax=Podarcis lilfordi TaxID=74358 RepID=A0AA35KAQ2_9SAUR|nr:inositol polyphosphate multikinase [Podarcis lilfordi]
MATEPPRCAASREPERLLRGAKADVPPGSASSAAAEGEEEGGGGRSARLLNGCVPLSHQVAGHMYGKDKGGILQHPDGTVLKQLQPAPRGPRELEFYNKVYAADCEDSVFLELQKYLPKYYGTWSSPTAPNGVAQFFHNGFCLRKDAVAASIQKIKEILQWFEKQKQLNFYASSLLFVYDGLYPMTTTWLNDGSLVEKGRVSKGQVPSGGTLEYNNNIRVISSTENGKVETSVGKGFSKMYALHKRHQSQISLKVETVEQDNIWKSSACLSQEHLNGNVIPQLEKVFCHMPTTLPESMEVEVRMIDFAHVFPSNTHDEGYIHGLKNLITVLQNILDT